MKSEEKSQICPYCKEEVKLEATKCEHCNSVLVQQIFAVRLTVDSDYTVDIISDGSSQMSFSIDGNEYELDLSKSIDEQRYIEIRKSEFHQVKISKERGKLIKRPEITHIELIEPYLKELKEAPDTPVFTSSREKKPWKCIRCKGLWWCVRGGSILTPCGWVHNSRLVLSANSFLIER